MTKFSKYCKEHFLKTRDIFSKIIKSGIYLVFFTRIENMGTGQKSTGDTLARSDTLAQRHISTE